jgi:hypothetical protein
MKRREYENLFQREPPWSWRRGIRAALRRIVTIVLSMLVIMIAFWLVLMVFGSQSPG